MERLIQAMSASEAWEIISELPQHHRDAFARSTLEAVLLYAETGKVEPLEDFAGAVARSLDFRRRHPDLAKTMNNAPRAPVGPGRSVSEGFAEIRRARTGA
jgi:hypothetical protein